MTEELSEMHLKILDSAISLLEQGGESAVRLRSVAEQVGIAEPTLYHYFTDRETLIIAAHTRRLKVNLATTIDPFLAAVHSCKNQEEFLDVLLGVYHHSYQPERASIREVRAELIGASMQREKLRASVVEEINSSLEASIAAIDFAKEQGWMKSTIDSKAFALFNLSLISSAVFAEMQNDAELVQHWKNLGMEAITAIVMNSK